MTLGLSFYLVCLTMVVLIGIFIYTLRAKRRGVLQVVFMMILVELFLWQGAVILETLLGTTVRARLFWDNLTYIGSAFVPVSMLLLGLAYGGEEDNFKKAYWLLLLVPAFTQLVIWTNDWHHLFYRSFDPMTGAVSPGTYFFVHAGYSYLCLVVSFLYQSYYAVKRSGALSVQSLLIIVGNLVPTVVNVCYTLNLPGFSVYSTPIAFTITALCYLWGIVRYNLLIVTPVATQTVINRISDSFVVIDPDLNVLDFNRTFETTFAPLFTLIKGTNGRECLTEEAKSRVHLDRITRMVNQVSQEQRTISQDASLIIGSTERHFTVEYTPIIQRKQCTAVILLFKDVTQHVRDMQQLQANQDVLLERERLASLGQMIGGIAHNMKTPIMSLSGGLDELQALAEEYQASIDDPEVNSQDHFEIAQDMLQWLGKMRTHLSYMSEVLSTVKDQASKFNTGIQMRFTLEEVLRRVGILMQHELTKHNCRLVHHIEMDEGLALQGDLNSLIQILDNIIANAIQAYDGQSGDIELTVKRGRGDRVQFIIRDHGKGISPEVSDRLFKEMITTRGKHGTGLGLYMSYSTIKAVFRGHMWFDSQPGEGTAFTVEIPILSTGEGGQPNA